MTDSDVTSHEITGVCATVELQGDWTKFDIDIGKQYPVKLSTKKDDIIAAGMAAYKAKTVAVWKYGEVLGGENPHRPGERFKNRYLNEVVAATDEQIAEGKAEAAGAAFVVSTVDHARRDRLIVRQTIVKAVAPLLITVDGEGWNTPQVLEVASAVEAWVYRGLEEPAKPEPTKTAVGHDFDDDSIPF
jgi:hypothetical protein